MYFFVRGLDEKKNTCLKEAGTKRYQILITIGICNFNFLNLKTRRLVVSVRLSDWYLF